MEFAMNNGFSELSFNEMEMIDGGGFLKFCAAVGGAMLVGNAPLAGVLTAAAITGPVGLAVAAGVFIGAITVGGGLIAIDAAI